MTREEAGKMYAVFVTYYPGYFKSNTRNDALAWVNAWADALEAYSYAQVSQAFKMYIQDSQSQFPPVPGQLIARMKQTDPAANKEGDALKAWDMVMKAAANSSYGAQEEFDHLPPLVQETIHSPEFLKEMAADEDFFTHSSVYQSNFLRDYRLAKERHDREMSYSPEIRQAIEAARTTGSDAALPDFEKEKQALADQAAQIRNDATNKKTGENPTAEQLTELLRGVYQSLGDGSDETQSS